MSQLACWKRSWVVGLVCGAIGAFGLAGCSSNNPAADAGSGNDAGSGTDSGMSSDAGQGNDAGPMDAGQPPPSLLTLSQLADSGFASPMATAVSASGTTVYFTAFDATGDAGVWSVSSGGAVAEVSVGAPFVMPSGLALSADNGTLYVADVASASTLPDGGANDEGALWTVPTAGGSAQAIAVTGLIQPVAVTLSADGTNLLVSAKDATGAAGVFKVPPAGGPAVAEAQTGLNDPGEASDLGGALWVAEHRAPSGYGALLRYVSGTGTDESASAFQFGFPGGLVASTDGSRIYATYFDGVNAGILYTPANGVGTGGTVTFTPGGALSFPSGLSRAQSADIFAFTDGEGTTGSVYEAR